MLFGLLLDSYRPGLRISIASAAAGERRVLQIQLQDQETRFAGQLQDQETRFAGEREVLHIQFRTHEEGAKRKSTVAVQ